MKKPRKMNSTWVIYRLTCSIALLSLTPLMTVADTSKLECKPIPNNDPNSNSLLLECLPSPQTVNKTTTSEGIIVDLKDSKKPSAQKKGATSGQASKDRTIGQPSTEDISRLFLRESEVLLKPKEIQLSIGTDYIKDDSVQSLRSNRNRTLSIPLGISVGLTKNTEVFASVPLLYTEQEFNSFDDSVKNESSGIGDLSFGLSYQLLEEKYSRPSLTGSLTILSPTGEEADPNNPDSVGLGSGFWSISTSASITKSVDPAVLFLSLGYSHRFAEEQSGGRIQPGDTFDYSFGAGFSINNLVTLSGRIIGAYSQENELDGQKLVGSSIEPVSMNMGITYQIDNKNRLETNVRFGVNNDADDISIGLTYLINI